MCKKTIGGVTLLCALSITPASKTRYPAVARESRPYRLCPPRSSASDFQLRRESDFPEVTQFHARYENGTLLSKATIDTRSSRQAVYQQLQSLITNANIVRRFRKFFSP